MSDTSAIPSRPVNQWPVGMRLRFKIDADMRAAHEHRRGAPVVVMSDLRLVGPSPVDGGYSWRQEVLSLGGGATVGWARPDQLELPRDELDREPDYLRNRRKLARPQSRNSP